MACKWLAPGGLLDDLASLDELGATMFGFIAPTAPEATLSAIERAIKNDTTGVWLASGSRLNVAELLRSLAYEPILFDRSVALLVFLASEKDSDHDKTIRSFLVRFSSSGCQARTLQLSNAPR